MTRRSWKHRSIAAILALAATPGLALATTKVRVEWVSAPIGGVSITPSGVYGAQNLSATGGATPALSTAAPAFGLDQSGAPLSVGLARVTVLSGAAILAWGQTPVASELTGLRLQVGQQVELVISAGQKVSVVEAADAPVAVPVSTNQ